MQGNETQSLQDTGYPWEREGYSEMVEFLIYL